MSVPVLLSIPDEIGPQLLATAQKQKTTIQGVILKILGDHLSVEVTPPTRGRPKKSREEAKIDLPER